LLGASLLEFVEIIGDGVAVEVEAFGDEAGLGTLMAHADDEKFDFGLVGVVRVIDGLLQILNFLMGELNFNYRLSQAR